LLTFDQSQPFLGKDDQHGPDCSRCPTMLYSEGVNAVTPGTNLPRREKPPTLSQFSRKKNGIDNDLTGKRERQRLLSDDRSRKLRHSVQLFRRPYIFLNLINCCILLSGFGRLKFVAADGECIISSSLKQHHGGPLVLISMSPKICST
jgi:hypothetical protein